MYEEMVVYQTRYQNKIQQQYSRNSHSRRHWRKFWQLWLDPLRILCENVLCSHGWTLKGRSSWLSGEGTFSFLKNETGKTAFKVSVSFCIPIRNKRELLLMPGFDSAAREQMHILPPPHRALMTDWNQRSYWSYLQSTGRGYLQACGWCKGSYRLAFC